MPLTDHRTYDQVWDPQWKSSKLLLLPGEEANGSPHAIVLGNVDVVVDGANPAGSASYRHVQQSIWDVHAQDAVWSQAHPDDGEYTRADGVNDNASVQGADIVEVLNVASNPDVEVEYAENRWNAGFRFGVVAASDCHFRELWDVDSPGEPTTHVFVAQRSVRGILDGFRDGRTTVSQNLAGPFLTIEADVDGDRVFEAMGGDEVVVADRKLSKKASLRVKVKGGKGTTLYVYAAPGRSAGPVATFRPQKANETYELPLVMKGTDHSWYRVEARSPGSASGSEADPNLPDQLRGATSPIFLSVGAPAVPKPEIALPVADTRADKATLVAGEQGGFTGFSDVAVSGKNTHLVAESHEKQATKVVYRRLDSKGRLTKALTLSERSATARFPRVVAMRRQRLGCVAGRAGQGAAAPARHPAGAEHRRRPLLQVPGQTQQGQGPRDQPGDRAARRPAPADRLVGQQRRRLRRLRPDSRHRQGCGEHLRGRQDSQRRSTHRRTVTALPGLAVPGRRRQ